MNIKWMIVIVALMLAVVIVLQVMPRNLDLATGKVSLTPKKEPEPARSTTETEADVIVESFAGAN